MSVNFLVNARQWWKLFLTGLCVLGNAILDFVLFIKDLLHEGVIIVALLSIFG